MSDNNKQLDKPVDLLQTYSVVANSLYDWETWEDQEGRLIFVSNACEKISGYSINDFMSGRVDFSQIVIEEDKCVWTNHLNQRNLENPSQTLILRIVHKDGRIIWIEHNDFPVMDDNGGYLGYRSNNREVTLAKTVEESLKKSEEEYRLLFDNAVEAILVLQDAKIKKINPMVCALTQREPEELINHLFLDFVVEEDRQYVIDYHRRRLSFELEHGKVAFRIMQKNGDVKWIESEGMVITWEGRPATINFVIDITQRKQIEDALKQNEEKYRFLAENATDVIWVYNLEQKKFTYISPAVYKLRGYTVEEAMAQTIYESIYEENLIQVDLVIGESLKAFLSNPEISKDYIYEFRQPCKNGTNVWVEISCKFCFNHEQQIEIIGVSRNIDERKRNEAQVKYLSFNDHLTGLYNRRYYEEELKRLDVPRNLPISMVMADVNGLKLTNDAFGHISGDRLLRTFATILRNEVRSDEIIARIGGDEFVILMPHTSHNDVAHFVQRLKNAINTRVVEDVVLSVSFGYATKERMETSLDHLFTEAEDEMYSAKLIEGNLMKRETIYKILKRLNDQSDDLRMHNQRISDLCKYMAIKLGMNQKEIDEMALLGLVHDLGKIGLPEGLRYKSGMLSVDERYELRRHAELGYHILRSAMEFANIAEYVLCHHERNDGSGYPRGVKEERIPIQAQILCVVEAFDEMYYPTRGKEARTLNEIISLLRSDNGVKYNKGLVEILISYLTIHHD